MSRKTLFFSLILLIVASAAAAFAYTQFSKPEPAPAQPTNTNQSEEVNKSSWKTCINNKFSLKFNYPDIWMGCTDNENTLIFETNYQPYSVNLILEIKQEELDRGIQIQKQDSIDWRYQKITNGEIFGIPCGGALECSGVILGDDFYQLGWLVSSNQSRPEDWDGLWSPDHNVSHIDIWNILNTVERMN